MFVQPEPLRRLEPCGLMFQSLTRCSAVPQLEGLHMRVDRAAPAFQEGSGSVGGVHYERGRSVFVGNLPFDVEVRPQFLANSPCVAEAWHAEF